VLHRPLVGLDRPMARRRVPPRTRTRRSSTSMTSMRTSSRPRLPAQGSSPQSPSTASAATRPRTVRVDTGSLRKAVPASVADASAATTPTPIATDRRLSWHDKRTRQHRNEQPERTRIVTQADTDYGTVDCGGHRPLLWV